MLPIPVTWYVIGAMALALGGVGRPRSKLGA